MLLPEQAVALRVRAMSVKNVNRLQSSLNVRMVLDKLSRFLKECKQEMLTQ